MLEGDDDSGSRQFLCDECLESGEHGIRERLLKHAESLEEYAANLRRGAADAWEMPSMLQLKEYRRRMDLFVMAYHQGKPPPPDDYLPKRLYKNDDFPKNVAFDDDELRCT
jgi:hypothetical protein